MARRKKPRPLNLAFTDDRSDHTKFWGSTSNYVPPEVTYKPVRKGDKTVKRCPVCEDELDIRLFPKVNDSHNIMENGRARTCEQCYLLENQYKCMKNKHQHKGTGYAKEQYDSHILFASRWERLMKGMNPRAATKAEMNERKEKNGGVRTNKRTPIRGKRGQCVQTDTEEGVPEPEEDSLPLSI